MAVATALQNPRMGDELAAYLCSIDGRLVRYLEDGADLSSTALRHVRCYGVALVQGLVVPEHVHEDWADFFPLVVAFVLAYGSAELGHLARRATIFEGGGEEPLTDGDRIFLVSLLAELDRLLAQRSRSRPE
jgi:hypothetical protein